MVMEIRNLDYFAKSIFSLPDKHTYTKADLLIPDFLLEKDGELAIYYAAHNEYVNAEARLMVIGITPGWQQMERSLYIARQCLLQGLSTEEVARVAKEECRLYGSMRSHLVQMLDELNLHSYLDLPTCAELFRKDCRYLHTTSLIRYPVFRGEANYPGYQPKILDSEMLARYVYNSFIPELESLAEPLVIPLGKAVEQVLLSLIAQGAISRERCLLGFPHPSGANGHRLKQFAECKVSLLEKVKHFFS